MYATDVLIARDSVSFTLHIGNEKRQVRAPLFGKQVVRSILAAATAASHLGVPIDTIVKKIEERPATTHGMNAFYGLNHALIIDNSNGRSAAELQAALEYISIYSDKTRLILTAELLQEHTGESLETLMSAKKTQMVIAFLREQLTPDHVVLLQGDVAQKIQRVVHAR